MPRSGAIVSLLGVMLNAPLALATPDGPMPPPGYVDRSGLTELVFWQGVNGLFAGGALSSAFTAGAVDQHCIEEDTESSSKRCRDALARGSGVVLVGLAAGIATPLLVTRGEAVRTADALLVNRATLVGAMHGYIIPFAAGLEPLESATDEIAIREAQWLSGLTFVGDVLGVGAGAWLALEYDPTPGFVSFLGTLHMTTFMAAMSIGSSFPEEINQDDARLISGISLAAADLALAAGVIYGQGIDIGRNRVFWLDTGAVVGWLAGGGIGSVIAGEEERAVAIGGTLGMAAGLAATYWVTRDSEPWRNRHSEDGDAEDASGEGIAFRPPRLRIEPVYTGRDTHLRWAVDLLWGEL